MILPEGDRDDIKMCEILLRQERILRVDRFAEPDDARINQLLPLSTITSRGSGVGSGLTDR